MNFFKKQSATIWDRDPASLPHGYFRVVAGKCETFGFSDGKFYSFDVPEKMLGDVRRSSLPIIQLPTYHQDSQTFNGYRIVEV